MDKKISQLPQLTNVDGAFMPVEKSGSNFKVSPFAGFVFSTAGSVNAYTLTVSGVNSYFVGLTLKVKFHVNNTGASTLNVNSLGTKSIRFGGANVVAGNLVVSRVYILVYDGTHFEIVSSLTSGNVYWGVITGNLADQTDLKNELKRIENLIFPSDLGTGL